MFSRLLKKISYYLFDTKHNHWTLVLSKGNFLETPINDHMITGTFWYKKSKDFVESAEHQIKNNIRINNEFYVGTSINYLIEKGMKVYVFEVNKWISFGDPVELELYYFWEDYFNEDSLL